MRIVLEHPFFSGEANDDRRIMSKPSGGSQSISSSTDLFQIPSSSSNSSNNQNRKSRHSAPAQIPRGQHHTSSHAPKQRLSAPGDLKTSIAEGRPFNEENVVNGAGAITEHSAINGNGEDAGHQSKKGSAFLALRNTLRSRRKPGKQSLI
jgi:hypothetical protein